MGNSQFIKETAFWFKKKKSKGSNVIYNNQNLICYSSYSLGNNMEKSIWSFSKSSSGVEDSYTYLTLSLPLSQWNDSVTWSTLCRKCVLYTTPPSEKLSYANVTVKKRERGSRDSNAEGYGTKWNCDFGLLQSSVIWVSFKSTIIKMVQGSFEIFCLTFLL